MLDPKDDSKAMQSPQIEVAGISIAWQPNEGTCTFDGFPVAMMWVDTTLKGLMAGVQSMVGTRRFELALQSEGRKSVDQDWQVISTFPTFEEGFAAIANIAAVAGWGRWEILLVDREACECRFRAANTWESRFQKASGLSCESAMLGGKLAGYVGKLFGFNCWATQEASIAGGDPYDVFHVRRSNRTVEDELEKLLSTDEATRADMAAAIEKLRMETARATEATRALQESERRYRLIADNSADVIWAMDMDLRFTFMSPSILQQRGYTVEEAVVMSLAETLEPESYDQALKAFFERIALVDAGDETVYEPFVFEAKQRHKDGHTIITSNHIRLVKGVDGRPGGVQGISRDVTKDKRARHLAEIQQEMALGVSAADDVENTLDVCLQSAIRAAEMDAGGIYLVDEDTGGLTLSVARGLSSDFVEAGAHYEADSSLVKLMREGDPVYASSSKLASLLGEVQKTEGLHSLAMVPIKGEGHVIAYLYVASHDQTVVHPATQRALESMASQMGSHITRSLAISALRASEARYQAVFENAYDGIIVMKDAVFVDANEKALDMFGCSREQFIGRSPVDFSPDFQPDGMTSREKAVDKLRAALKGEPEVFNWSHVKLDGTPFDAEVSLNRVEFPDGLRLLAVVRDRTERKKAEAAIAFEAGFRRVLGDVTKDLIALPLDNLDASIERTLAAIGQFINADRSVVIRFDFDRGTATTTHEWCGAYVPAQVDSSQEQSILAFEPFIDRLAALEPVSIPDVSSLAAGPARERFESQGTRSSALVPLVSRGDRAGIVGFDFLRSTWELTSEAISLLEFASATLSSALDRKRTEQEKRVLEEQLRQSQKMEAIGRLAGGVAHDFNNMLCGIIGHADLLLVNHSMDDATHQSVEQISAAAMRATELTQQLLAFSRKQIVTPKVVSLSQIIESLHPMLTRLIGEHITLRTLSARTLGHVRADPSQVEQIVLNLAVNARDAMPRGGELVIETSDIDLDDGYCETHAKATPGSYVLLVVSDTGHGMSPEIRERIFEPFFTTKKLGQGTGLGLATVYGIVEQSGGRIEVYSEAGRGTSFKVYFPRVDDTEASSDVSSTAIDLPGGDETVLVVEDEQLVRILARRILEQLGYTVLDAASGEEAIELVKRHRGPTIDLLLTDVVMPNMNGRELADQLLELIPQLKVLFTSGYTHSVITNLGIIDDGVQFVLKPYTLKTLADRVRQVLDAEGGTQGR